jgi:glycosyltransferase involved in cell wall biosynthesis
VISTIVLSWNRAVLLEQTLRSFAATAVPPFELIVVDNASSDRCREVIEEARRLIPGLQTIYNDENTSGEALNPAIERATGALIHIHENDVVLLPGWQEHVVEAFRAFPGLGQLSLVSGVPTDDYPGEPQPATLRFSGGKILYEAHSNVASTSILRAELFHVHGIRVHNIPPLDADAFTFGDDRRLSADVKANGFFVAWSDRRYVRNLGHEPQEFDRDPEYYRRNYASKRWIGTAGFSERRARAIVEPRPRRYSTVFPQPEIQPERTAGNCAGVAARLWSMLDSVSPEVEVLDFLHALVRLAKPRRVLDTSAWLGRSAIAIGVAIRENGFGTLETLVGDPEVAAYASAAIADAGLAELVTVRDGSDARTAASEPFDVAFFGSRNGRELLYWYDALADGATLVFHGPTNDAPVAAGSVESMSSAGLVHGFAPVTPRGLFVGKLAKPANGVLSRVPAQFDARAYLQANPDVAQAGVDPADHYRRLGWREERRLRE